jgi:hypothetical protein
MLATDETTSGGTDVCTVHGEKNRLSMTLDSQQTERTNTTIYTWYIIL